jgi:hypothetical protein
MHVWVKRNIIFKKFSQTKIRKYTNQNNTLELLLKVSTNQAIEQPIPKALVCVTKNSDSDISNQQR